jgi:hypothetical protein
MLTQKRTPAAKSATPTPSALGDALQDPLQDPLTKPTPGPPVRREWEGGKPALDASRGGGGTTGTVGGSAGKTDPGKGYSKLLNANLATDPVAHTNQYNKGANKDLATTDKLTTPRSFGTGTAQVATGVKVGGGVNDAWSMSLQYQTERKLDPRAGEEELWKRAIKNDANPGGAFATWKPAADPVQAGHTSPIDNTRVDKPSRSPQRRAVVVANVHYKGTSWAPLAGAGADAAQMQATLQGDDYEVTRHDDKDSPGIAAAFDGCVAGAAPGDEITLYYAGHGVKDGMVGMNSVQTGFKQYTDIALYTQVAKHTTKAISGGYHLRIIVDACESAALVDQVALEARNVEGGGQDKRWEMGNPYDATLDPKRMDAVYKGLTGKYPGADFGGHDALLRVLETQYKL